MKLSVTQKLLRPVINWLVETFFPSGAFYGHDFFDIFKDLEKEGYGIAQASTAFITHNMHRMNAEKVKFEIEGVTINGEPVGDFEIIATLTTPKRRLNR